MGQRLASGEPTYSYARIATMHLLTNAEAASMLGIKPNTLEIWRCKGRGPRFIKFLPSKQAPVRYRREEVDAWLEQQAFASTSAYSPAAHHLHEIT